MISVNEKYFLCGRYHTAINLVNSLGRWKLLFEPVYEHRIIFLQYLLWMGKRTYTVFPRPKKHVLGLCLDLPFQKEDLQMWKLFR